eukprot:SAG31_NODE_20304_length_578_cov_0.958246_1_plen_154_part_10
MFHDMSNTTPLARMRRTTQHIRPRLAASSPHDLHAPSSGVAQGLEVSDPDGEGVVVVRMNSKPVNTLTAEFIAAITGTFQSLAADPKAKGVVLTSGLRAFSAGLDLNAISPAPTRTEFEAFWQAFENMYRTILLSPLATACAINGSAPDGGTLL